MSDDNQQPRGRGRWQLILLVVLFATPVVASYVMYYMHWLPEARSNKGELIEPVKAMPDFSAPSWDGQRFTLSSLQDKWVMLAYAKEECGETCQRALYTMRQVRKALGKAAGEVERVLLLDADRPPADSTGLMQDYAGTHFLLVDEQVRRRWLGLFEVEGKLPDGEIFYIDPYGNLMMRYRPGQEPKDLFSDMDTLLSATGYH